MSTHEYDFLSEGAPPRAAIKAHPSPGAPPVAPLMPAEHADPQPLLDKVLPEKAKSKLARYNLFFPKRRLRSLSPGSKVRVLYRKPGV